VWRPEWTPQRTCLYWYLTFREEAIAEVVSDDVLRLVQEVGWVDPVPPRWCHVTVTDVGFTDELEPNDVEAVTAAVTDAVRDEGPLRLTFGPVQPDSSAVVLETGPLDRLRTVKEKIRRATALTLGARHADFHRDSYRPHVSLGYTNRAVDAKTVSRFLQAAPPVEGSTDVNALTLAAVTRLGRGYQWEVEAQVGLPGGAASSRH
jgi:2'-5' RNA ligase